MATKRISMLNHNTMPGVDGNVFSEPFFVKATNDVWKQNIWVFKDVASRMPLHGGFAVPKDYMGSAVTVLVWSSATITGNLVWDFDYIAVGGDDSESLDNGSATETLTVTDAAPSTLWYKLETTIALASAGIVADDEFEWILYRDGVNASDTHADDAILFNLLFQYSDT